MKRKNIKRLLAFICTCAALTAPPSAWGSLCCNRVAAPPSAWGSLCCNRVAAPSSAWGSPMLQPRCSPSPPPPDGKTEAALRGVDRIIIVDTLVIDKQDFLSAYPLSPDLGTLTEQNGTVQYQTQLNGMVLRAEGDSILQMVRYYLDNGALAERTIIEGLGTDGDQNYPFLMPDGQTFYFAARSEDGFGNYDLYVTRYDSESQQFYQAENMGFPYNSPANDYMLVIDENARLGWFASDRNQPEGKVCIYTFIPNETRHTIDYEATDLEEVKAAASLRSTTALPLTDEEQQAKADAQKRLAMLRSNIPSHQRRDFEFVLNDEKTCYRLSDFTSAEARQKCSEWVQKTKNCTELNTQLQQLRDASPSATQQILNMEARIRELQAEVHALEKDIRRMERNE